MLLFFVQDTIYYDPSTHQFLYRVRYSESNLSDFSARDIDWFSADWFLNVLLFFSHLPSCDFQEVLAGRKLYRDFFLN